MENLTEQLKVKDGQIDRAVALIREKDKRIAVLEAALKKYADEGNWGDWVADSDGEDMRISNAFVSYGGWPWEIAKEALGES